MANAKFGKSYGLVILLLLVLLAGIWLYLTLRVRITKLSLVKSDALLCNPMVGFAPNADHYELVQNKTLQSTLVYVDLTWRELEPQQGVFDFQTFESENYLEQWRSSGKRVVFRFVCDKPGAQEHMDIPDWLYQLTGGDGDRYNTDYGQGYSPNYNNELFIQYHKNAIQALGKRYGSDDFFCYIELGSLGHWGEWHTKFEDGIRKMPLQSVREQYIMPYLESFPNALILMRRPFTTAKENNLGIFNDMTGLTQATEIWLDWIKNGGEYDQTQEKDALAAMPDAWKTAPIGGEFTSAVSMKQLLADDIDATTRLIRQSHMSFIGPQCPSGESLKYVDGIEQVHKSLGYRLRIDQAALDKSPLKNSLNIKLIWVNDGMAPLYRNWDVFVYLFDVEGNEVIKAPVDVKLSTIVDDSGIQSSTDLSIAALSAGIYQVGIAIIDPMTEKPGVEFAMNKTRSDKIYILGQWSNE